MRSDILELIQNAMDYMEEHLKSEILIEELSEMAGYSEYHFCRLFQMVTGLSVKQYLVSRRLRHSIYEISSGAKKQEVAFSYGFDTYAGFYKAFCREYGCSPSEYQKMYQPSFPYRVNLLQEGKIMLSKKTTEKLLAHWGLEISPVSNVVYEGSNQISENEFYVGEEFVLKVSGLPGGLKRHMEIAAALEQVGLQASLPIATKKGELLVQEADAYAVLCRRVRGEKLSAKTMFADSDVASAYRFGVLIGKLHLALEQMEEGLCQENHLYTTVCNWALPVVQKKINFPQELATEYRKQFGEVYDKLPKQIIHRNMNLSYVYLNGEEMVGVTDFELSEYGTRLFDVCYAATGILSENFSDTEDVMQKWLPLYQNLVKGYDNVRKLTEEEKQALPYVVFSIQLICVAYFADKEQFAKLADVNAQMLKLLWKEKEALIFCE